MSQETLEFHHDLHHKAYVDNGNKLLAGSGHEDKSLEDIVKATYEEWLWSSPACSTTSWHWNHIQFWEMMGPTGRDMPSELESAIVDSFGSVDAFKEASALPVQASSARAGAGSSRIPMAGLRSPRPKTASTRCASARLRCSAAMYGNIPIISISATSALAYLTSFLDNLVNWENVASRLWAITTSTGACQTPPFQFAEMIMNLSDNSLAKTDSYINGTWRDAGQQPFALHNPATGEKLADIADHGADAVREAIEAAAAAQKAWAARTAKDRAMLMRAWFNLVMENQKTWPRSSLLKWANRWRKPRRDRLWGLVHRLVCRRRPPHHR